MYIFTVYSHIADPDIGICIMKVYLADGLYQNLCSNKVKKYTLAFTSARAQKLTHLWPSLTF